MREPFEYRCIDDSRFKTLTTAELGPGISPLVSGARDSLRLISSEISGVLERGIAREAGPDREWFRPSVNKVGSSSDMGSHDWKIYMRTKHNTDFIKENM